MTAFRFPLQRAAAVSILALGGLQSMGQQATQVASNNPPPKPPAKSAPQHHAPAQAAKAPDPCADVEKAKRFLAFDTEWNPVGTGPDPQLQANLAEKIAQAKSRGFNCDAQ